MLNKLEDEGYIKRLPTDPRRVENSLNLAKRDFLTANKMLTDENYDWAFNAYNSMLNLLEPNVSHGI